MSTARSATSAEVTVSVVIPCFQAHATLARTVASAAEQTMRALEAIVVDDASGEETPAVLRDLQRHYGADWLRIVRLERNQGPAAARNAGWAAARGDYVAFLDADDAWHPRKLEIQLDFMRRNPHFALTGHRHLIGGEFGSPAAGAPFIEIDASSLLRSNRFVTPSVMLRRDLALRFREAQRHMEDHLLWMKIALTGHRVARIELELVMLFKPQFGASGQSSELWQMQRAELGNYRLLRREGLIGPLSGAALALWSFAKFLRRLLIVGARHLRA